MFTFSDFNFIKLIGAGTFGKVYIVQLNHKNAPRDRYYALKMINQQSSKKLRQVVHTQCENEILVACRNSPFIVKLIATFTTDTHLCILMEYVSGGELFSWLKKKRRLHEYAVKFYSAQIVLALEYLHERNIIFRDLKPENILLNKDGYIKVTDFGFAKRIDRLTYTICGTPEYMAPEELDGEGHGREVDFWSLGILIYEMAIGVPPFYDPHSNEAIYEKITKDIPKFPKYVNPLLRDLIERLLIKEKHVRLGGIRGIVEVKEHPFFKGVDWEGLLYKRLVPPIQPYVRFNGDTSNFIEYGPNDMDEKDKFNTNTHYRFGINKKP